MEEEGRKQKKSVDNSVCDLFHFWVIPNYTQTSKQGCKYS